MHYKFLIKIRLYDSRCSLSFLDSPDLRRIQTTDGLKLTKRILVIPGGLTSVITGPTSQTMECQVSRRNMRRIRLKIYVRGSAFYTRHVSNSLALLQASQLDLL
ncbi:hypothetical protein V1477_018433 [Vespula maculifrons]|uniref:Uncharacterized protein n=1 Tax=Vespula maculifrons TaxID=7453 RepID=A0ABD2AVC0_VESMC